MIRITIMMLALVALASPSHARTHHRIHHETSPSIFQSSVVAIARSQVGNGAVYGRRNLWCARFMNWVLERSGYHGTRSDLAWSFASLPRTDMHVGAIAVMSRRGGGHVGIVSGIDRSGNPVIISGNHRHRVIEAVYPRSRIAAFVEPR